MPEYILFMHNDTTSSADEGWESYLAGLRTAGVFDGGSSIGAGECVAKAKAPPAITGHLTGYIRVRAASLADARALVEGNPVYEAGGTIEIRELPRD